MDWLDDARCEKVILAGHSSGARYAATLAAEMELQAGWLSMIIFSVTSHTFTQHPPSLSSSVSDSHHHLLKAQHTTTRFEKTMSHLRLDSSQRKKSSDVIGRRRTAVPWLEEEKDKPRAVGCVYFSFPLHGPGKADVKLNDLEVLRPKVPALFIRGMWMGG